MRRIGVIDGSLCTAQLSLWQGAAPAEMVLSCIGRLDQVGFDAIDVMDGPLFRQCVESGSNPWAWIRAAASRAKHTPLNVWVSTTTLFGAVPLSQDAIVRGVACLAKAGVRRLTCYDMFNDMATLKCLAQAAHSAGMHCCAALVFTNSTAKSGLPVAARQVAGDFDSVCLWDPAGAMSPEVARELLPRLVGQCGDVALELRTHCQSGRAEVTYLDAISAGVGALHTCVEALAGGISLPSFEHLLRTALGRRPDLDCAMAEGSSEYIAGFAERSGLALGRHQLTDFDAESFEIPSDLVRELDAMTAFGTDRKSLLEETRRLREEAGGVSMVYPLGGVLLQQAARSIQARNNSDTGQPRAAAHAVVKDRQGTSDDPSVESMRAGASEATRVQIPKLAAGISRADDELLIEAMFGPQLAETVRTNSVTMQLDSIQADTPLDLLISELKRRPEVRAISITKGDWRFELEA